MSSQPSVAVSEVSAGTQSMAGEATPAKPALGSYPPYPPYVSTPAPPSVADTIIAGRDLRVQHKSLPRQPVRPLPRPAKPKGPKATDVKMNRRALRQHARCLRRHGAVLTDRLERISKPPRRSIIYLWREHADTLPPETIARLRTMLDADEPFKPDQAYEYFINVRKTKKNVNKKLRVNQIKKDVQAICADKRFVWARNATVLFARGIQQRLTRPGRYALADGMLRLSNIIMDEICGYMKMRTPSRRCTHPKAKFMMEMSDKVAVWIDEILSESDDRMLMMDFDEDEEVERSIVDASRPPSEQSLAHSGVCAPGNDTGSTPDPTPDATPTATPDTTPGSTPGATAAPSDTPGSTPANTPAASNTNGGLLIGPTPAYLKFTGEMLEAFMILTDSMYKKGNDQLLSHGKFQQTYSEGADELKEAPDFEATEFNTTLANQLNKDLTELAKPNTPSNIAPYMKNMVDICSNYLAQVAEYNKDKGPAFKALVKQMKTKPNDQLYQKGKAQRTYGKGATELEKSKGLESHYDDPNLSQEIHSKLSKLMEGVTPPDLKEDMAETVDTCSKYLSQNAVDENERGPAFDILINKLVSEGGQDFTPQFKELSNKYVAAYALKSAPGLCSATPDPATAPTFSQALHKAVDDVTPPNLQKDMDEVVDRCANYLSAFVRDRDKALQVVLKAMKTNGSKELAKRNNYAMNYSTGATEVETAPVLVPYLPVKDIADENKEKLSKDVHHVTPAELKMAVKSAVSDVSKHLSQPIALRSGAAGARYGLDFLGKMMHSMGDKVLFKHKSYGQTYADGSEVLKYAGPLEHDHRAENLQLQIATELNTGVPSKTAPTIAHSMAETIGDSAKHLAKVGREKGEAVEHLVKLMKEEGEAPLGNLQGYDQTFKDGARRIEISDSLANDKVDKGAYEGVRSKITEASEKNPNSEHAKVMPGVIDEASKFLASPFPETAAEKRRVLGDLMARKGSAELAKEGIYKIDHTEGGKEIMQAPVGVHEAHDQGKKKEMEGKITSVIPESKLRDVLKETASEGAAHLTDVVQGRGEAMAAIQRGLEKEGDKEFLNIGKFNKTYKGAADMLSKAPSFGGENPNGILLGEVADRLGNIDKKGSPTAMQHMDTAVAISSKYIADVATKESGLDAKGIAAWSASGGGKSGSGRKSDSELTDEERRRRAEGERLKRGRSGSETEEERRRRLEEEERKKRLEEEERRKRLEEEERRRTGGKRSLGTDSYDSEREQALSILHKQLNSKGGETFYKQPHTELTHKQASEWLSMKPPMQVVKSVKESGDTARLHQKFERKMNALVDKCTPIAMKDIMQDVVIESSRILSEYFVAKNYKALVKEGLISEMQKRGNEILIEKNGKAETSFFAAQRLKKSKTLDVAEPDTTTVPKLVKKMDEIIRCRSMARKLTATMKDHIKDAADYLSTVVTKPDEQIQAYEALINEMEAQGDALLIQGDIPKSYKDCATYLRSLTSCEDQIRLPNSSLQSSTENKLHTIMANVPVNGYTQAVLKSVISDTTRLLVSYIMLQGVKTEALQIVVEQLDCAADGLLLRHGAVRKSNADGAELLRGRNTDQLIVTSADPVVARKVQIKLDNLMEGYVPAKYKHVMDEVIAETTMFLAVHLVQPRVIQVCKCMKSVFVQCELWCDEILRRVARPCCTCSRQVSAQALAELAPGERVTAAPGSMHASAPGTDIALRPCAARSRTGPRAACPARKPTSGCDPTASYMLYSTEYDRERQYVIGPTRLPRSPSLDSTDDPIAPSRFRLPPAFTSRSPFSSPRSGTAWSTDYPQPGPSSATQQVSRESSPMSFYTPLSSTLHSEDSREKKPSMFWQSPQMMYAHVSWQETPTRSGLDTESDVPKTVTPTKEAYSCRAPIISTDQMGDWHSMMVSLTWNVQAWRNWIQETIDRALEHHHTSRNSPDESWSNFRRRIATEALQWRQYNLFSRQLTLRLALRYRNKQIVSPTRATVKTQIYMECQKEMLEIINMFNRWTHWLSVVVKETDSLQSSANPENPLQDTRWNYFKNKVEEYAEDWIKYNMHLKICWEHQYMTLIKDWLPTWSEGGPVWVVSACGAVPSGAVAAGDADGEALWVARTTHRCRVLPAALRPSRHSCLLYADGAVHYYTKYQVLCNASVSWVAWRAGEVGARAVRVAPGVHVGRVLYRGSHLVGAVHAPANRCHVVIFGRPFAFNCYELLVLTD